MHVTTDELGQLYEDVSACLMALSNALEKAGALPKTAIAEAATERLATLRALGKTEERSPLVLLHTMATRWQDIPSDLEPPAG